MSTQMLKYMIYGIIGLIVIIGLAYYVLMKKSVYNKFIKLKKKRGQTDNDM